MAREHEAEKLLRDGLSPSQIAERMGISVNSVLQYLRTRVGEGSLKLSDIFYAIPRDTRGVFDKATSEGHVVRKTNFRKLPRGD